MNFELSILAAFGAMLCWGFGDFCIQRATRKIGDVQALAFIGSIGALGLFPFVLPELPLLFYPQNLVLLCFVGAVTFVVAMLNFEALKKGKLSVIEVIMEIELPITAMLGFLFFKESLSFPQLAIIAAIFLGIILISVSSFSQLSSLKKLEKGVILAVFAAVGMGLVNFLTAFGSKQISPLMIIWMPWIIIALVSLLFIMPREGLKNFFQNAKKFKALILAMAIFDTIAWLLFAFAVLKNELAVTTAITESYPAVALFLGLWLNKENILPHQFAGAGIALGASVLLGFFV